MRRKLVALFALCTVVATACTYETRDFAFEAAPPQTSQTSFIYAGDGSLITDLKAEENRINKRIDEIPLVVQHAVVAIEDERFYLHAGIDLRGIVRAARSNVSSGGVSQGASTITQQYVGNVYLDRNDRTASRKIEEIMLARSFENEYSKDAILELYLNWVYFGNNAYGVQAAAEEYFDKDVEDLDLSESSLLAGLIQRPSTYDPFRNPDAASRRRTLVLDRMLANEYISVEEREEALATPVSSLVVDRSGENVAFGDEYPAAHFVEEVKAWFLENEEFGATYQEREDLLFRGGIEIHTTVDLELQADAEDAVEAIIPSEGNPPDAAATVLDTDTGAVLAMVGGRDFFGDSEFARVNLAMGDGRQAGSSMKPIALAAALQSGAYDVTSVFPAPSSIEIPIPGVSQPWRVKGGGGGSASLIRATRSSYNTVYAQLMQSIGPESFIDMAHELGIESEIAPVLAAVLGTENVTTLDMATAFATLGNSGIRNTPYFVERILNSNGTTLWEHRPDQHKALDAPIADQISWVLEGVISGGTGTNADIGRPAAGKTGTAQNFGDATFVGYTPQRATAVWVGYPQAVTPMVPPTTPIRVFGGEWPASIWREIMLKAMEDLPVEEFPEPPASTTSTTIPVPRASVEVPNVVGMTAEAAMAALEEAGLTGSAFEVESNEFAPGTVVNQAPIGGSFVRGDNVITLEVAIPVAATETPTVPDVMGSNVVDAESFLRSSGFVVEVIYQDDGAGGAADIVWQQSPAAGGETAAGATVTIYVNIG